MNTRKTSLISDTAIRVVPPRDKLPRFRGEAVLFYEHSGSNTETGEQFDQDSLPWDVRKQIDSAIRGHRTAGICYSGGNRIDWGIYNPEEDDIDLVFTRDDMDVDRVVIPGRGGRLSRPLRKRGM